MADKEKEHKVKAHRILTARDLDVDLPAAGDISRPTRPPTGTTGRGSAPRPGTPGWLEQLMPGPRPESPPPPARSRPAGDRGGWQPPSPRSPRGTEELRPRRGGLVVGMIIGGMVLAGLGGALVASMMDRGPSLADYVARADQVCASSNAEVSRVGDLGTYPDLASASGAMASGADGQLAGLRSLDRPSGSAGDEVSLVLAAFEATSLASVRLAEAAGAGDDAATADAANQFGGAYNQARERAAGLGMQFCVVGLQDGVDAVFAGAGTVVRAGYVARAESICQATARDMASQEQGADFDSLVRLLRGSQAIIEDASAQLAALPVPPGDETQVGEMIEALEITNAKSAEHVEAIAAAEFARADALLLEVTRMNTTTNALLDDYGLEACGSNFGLL